MSNPDYHSDLKAGPKKPGIALKNLGMICRFDSFQKKWGFDILETQALTFWKLVRLSMM